MQQPFHQGGRVTELGYSIQANTNYLQNQNNGCTIHIYIYKTDSEGIHSTMWGSLRLAPMNITQQCSDIHVISEILGHCCDRQSDKHQCGKVDQGS